jgi:hypothetical protein
VCVCEDLEEQAQVTDSQGDISAVAWAPLGLPETVYIRRKNVLSIVSFIVVRSVEKTVPKFLFPRGAQNKAVHKKMKK